MPFDWGSVVGAGISAVSSLAGGALSDASNRGISGRSLDFAREQLAFQREAAQSGIRWKVADAKAAGIHPLYALGATTFSPSPVSYSPQRGGDLGRGLADAGQHVSRAVQSTMGERERISNDLLQAQLEGQMLSNDGQRIENRARATQVGPPMAGDPAPGRVGISSTFLDPPRRDSQGNHVLYTAQGSLTFPSGWSKAQDVEDTVGDVMSEIVMAVNLGDLGIEQAQSRIDRLWEMMKRNRAFQDYPE